MLCQRKILLESDRKMSAFTGAAANFIQCFLKLKIFNFALELLLPGEPKLLRDLVIKRKKENTSGY